MKKGILVVISGFSGAGKGTIMNELLKKHDYHLSISATTRKPRLGEEDGVQYYFRTQEEFLQMIAEGELIEWAEYVGNYYGTPKKYVEEQLNKGKDVLLEIEMQGGMLVKEKYPDALLIFISPPSASALKDRLIGRGTETSDEIDRRLKRAVEEVKFMKDYDYIIVNDVLDQAVEQIDTLIRNEHFKASQSNDMIENIQNELSVFTTKGV